MFIERLQTLVILLAVGLGIILGQISFIQAYAEYLIVPFLLLMLYGLFLAIPLHDLKNSFRNVKFSSTSLVINFIWTPVLAWALGALFLADHPALWIGLIMLMVTPCTDWYLVFTGIAKGNVALSTSILPVNLILQLLLLPVYMLLFAGVTGTVQMSVLIESILLVLLVPFALAGLTRFLSRRLNQEQILEKKLLPFFGNAQIIFLGLALQLCLPLKAHICYKM